MADRDLRSLERALATGDSEAQARRWLDLLRTGRLRREQLELRAYLQCEAAGLALGLEALPPEPENTWTWVREIARLDFEVGVLIAARAARLLLPAEGERRSRLAVEAAEAWLARKRPGLVEVGESRELGLAALEAVNVLDEQWAGLVGPPSIAAARGAASAAHSATTSGSFTATHVGISVTQACRTLGEERVRAELRQVALAWLLPKLEPKR